MKKILIANRGEIALRIMKTCKKMGIATVAIYSDADKYAPFVKFADQAINIGPPPSSESYLKQDKIIEISKKLNVDGIHPGYGFLSENSEFSNKVKKAGIIFIGPSAESMEMMGDKLSAKKIDLRKEILRGDICRAINTDMNQKAQYQYHSWSGKQPSDWLQIVLVLCSS